MSQLALEHKAINLSQGFPDFDAPVELINMVNRYMLEGKNQYAPMAGLGSLRERIAEHTNRAYGSTYDPDTDITVTAGGTQAIFTALAATIEQGDEVITFEPAYDSYGPTVRLLGGLVKPFELSPPNYKIDWPMVKKLISSRTRMIILNSPHNPTGAILDDEDMQQLISITRGTDILILSDEVYGHLVYDGREHCSIARYPELRERSFITASFGKLFHTTGWKVGYCIAPEPLMNEFRKVHQFLVFSVNTPVQYAIAEFLKDENYYHTLNSFFQKKRDLFRDLMQETRFKLLPCAGSYFQCADYRNISQDKDIDFVKRMTVDFGVAAIPNSAFYNRGTDFNIIRFCFAKKQETLEKAVNLLTKV